MLEDREKEKIETEQNKHFLEEYLYERGINEPICVESSIYNDDGIEVMKETKQKIDDIIYFSRATRLENRMDMIKIERAEQKSNGDASKLSDMYQIRWFQVGLEDIEPDMEEVDPLNVMGFDVLGMPPIYQEVSLDELKSLRDNDGKTIPFTEQHRQQIFEKYKKLNSDYGRTKAFEKGIAKMLIVKDLEARSGK